MNIFLQELDININHIESTNSKGIYTIHMKCDCRDEETKADLEAKLKTCSGMQDKLKFLSISEADEGTI